MNSGTTIIAGDRVKVVTGIHRIPAGTVARVLSVWKGQDAPYQLEGYESCLLEDTELELVDRQRN